MKEVCFAEARDPENRSRKRCCCGGHNASNAKSTLTHHGTAARVRVRKSRKRRALVRAFLCASLTLCACSGARQAAVPPPAEAPYNACIPLIERCEKTGTAVDCDAAEACLCLWERASLEWSWRKELEDSSAVDAGVAARKLANTEQRVEELEIQRWYWLGGGSAAGAVLVIILMLAL